MEKNETLVFGQNYTSDQKLASDHKNSHVNKYLQVTQLLDSDKTFWALSNHQPPDMPKI